MNKLRRAVGLGFAAGAVWLGVETGIHGLDAHNAAQQSDAAQSFDLALLHSDTTPAEQAQEMTASKKADAAKKNAYHQEEDVAIFAVGAMVLAGASREIFLRS